ncbi:MAG: hypothetical protein L0H19_02270 [Salinisphaera sp.]|nr:hypothetical protein [Salinisphaera sp.]
MSPRPMIQSITAPVTRHDLEACIKLCRRHLLGMQTAQGNFQYEYDWQTGEYQQGDNAVRQAGTLWGLANLYRLRPDPALLNGCVKGLAFYDEYSATTARGSRFSTYIVLRNGMLGSVALVALSLVEMLRSPAAATASMQDHWRSRLDEYLGFLVAAQRPDGRGASQYEPATGHPHGQPSPYFDGEALLALCRAAGHLDVPGLDDAIARGAAGAYRHYVLHALRRDSRSPQTCGYYHWGTMAMYEIVKSERLNAGDHRYAEIIDYLGDWQCRIRQLGMGLGNPAAGLEGLIHAYQLCAGGASADRFRDTIEACLRRMLSLQVGHPRGNDFVQRAPRQAPALGGCQARPTVPRLRIDCVQHQLHAALLALACVVRD